MILLKEENMHSLLPTPAHFAVILILPLTAPEKEKEKEREREKKSRGVSKGGGGVSVNKLVSTVSPCQQAWPPKFGIISHQRILGEMQFVL